MPADPYESTRPTARHVHTPAAGRTIGRYAMRDELARGGMGAVYRAHDPELDRDVALKLLLEDSPSLRKRFRREALAISRLEHPHVIPIYEVGESEAGEPFLVMPLLTQGSLQDRLRDGPLEPREAAEHCRQVAEALQFSHEHMILHRDVKPANVLLDDRGAPVLTDFGLAKFVEGQHSGATRTGVLVGTPSFMSPEQAAGKKLLDWRADVYSLGATLYALLTGKPPFDEESALELLVKIASEQPPPPSSARPEVPADLDTVCLKCLEKDPDDRYASAAELAEDLRRFVAGEPIWAVRPSRVARVRKAIARNSRAAGVIAGAVIAYVALSLGMWGYYWVGRLAKREAAAERSRAGAREFAGLPADATPDARATVALEWLLAAQEWDTRSPFRPAKQAHFDALLALAEVAAADGRGGQARELYLRAATLGVDDARARGLAEGLGED